MRQNLGALHRWFVPATLTSHSEESPRFGEDATQAGHYPLGYNPAFDGLRAIAVLAVMLDHFQVSGFKGGGLGVDVFFVLSGYLITAILVRGFSRGERLAAFYCRRFLRLVPALAFICATLLLVAPVLGVFTQAKWDVIASIFSVSNWTRAFPAGAPMYLGNTWSLAIEEQFYIVWPALLALSQRYGGRGGGLTAALVLLVVSLVWLILLEHSGGSKERLYNGFDTRCFGLLFGCAASLARSHLARLRPLFGPASVVASILFLALITQTEWSPAASIGVAILATIVIVEIDHRPSQRLARYLGQRPLVGIGRISYALYLWHYPIMLIILRETRMSWAAGASLGIALSLACATISYFAVEQPVSRLRDGLSQQGAMRLGRSAVTISVAGMLVGVWTFWSVDIVQRFYPSPLVIVAFGPEKTRRGEAFNVQPDGRSMLWLKASHSIPSDARFRIGNQLLDTFLQGASGVAAVPTVVRDTLGQTTLSIVAPDNTVLAGPVSFEVTP